MAILKNVRYEMFALALAQGLVPGKAYVKAGFAKKNAKSNAHRLLNTNEHIRQRVDEIKENISQKAQDISGINRAYIMLKLQGIAEYCERKNPTAANRSLELMGKEIGMFKDQLRIGDPNDKPIKGLIVNHVHKSGD